MKKFNRIGILLFLFICGVFLVNIVVSGENVEIADEIDYYYIDFDPPIFDQSSIDKWEKLASIADVNQNGISDSLEEKLCLLISIGSPIAATSQNEGESNSKCDEFCEEHQELQEFTVDHVPIIIHFPKGDIDSVATYFDTLGGNIDQRYELAVNGFAGSINYEGLLQFCESLNSKNVPFLLEEDGISESDLYYTTLNLNLRPYVWNNLSYKGDEHSSIAIIDGGIDPTHPSFAPGYSEGDFDYKIVGWKDWVNNETYAYDDGTHGTHCASIAAGLGNPELDELNRTVASKWFGVNRTGSGYNYTAGEHESHLQRFDVTKPGIIEIHCQFDDFTEGLDSVHIFPILKYQWNQEVARFESFDEHWNHTITYSVADDMLGEYFLDMKYILGDNTGDGQVFEPNFMFKSHIHWPFHQEDMGCGDIWQGVAPDAKIVALKTRSRCGCGSQSDMVAAVEWCINNKETYNITVISHSASTRYPGVIAEIDAANNAVESGILFLTSAGNDAAWHSENVITSPADADNSIAVAATNRRDEIAFYSSMGGDSYTGLTTKPDIAAPGGGASSIGIFAADSNGKLYCDYNNIPTDYYPNDLVGMYGTSMSTPCVAGAVNLLIEAMGGVQNWNFTALEAKRVKSILLMSASEAYPLLRSSSPESQSPSLDRGGKDVHEGYGRMNIDAAIEVVTEELSHGQPKSAHLCSSDIDPNAKHAFGCYSDLIQDVNYTFELTIPEGADFDVYIYSSTPSFCGEPILVASGISNDTGGREIVSFVPNETGIYYIVVKVITGEGLTTLRLCKTDLLFQFTLTNGNVHPNPGSQKTLMNFSVFYSDPNNLDPSLMNVLINGTPIAMEMVNIHDNNYIDGATFQCLTYLQPGEYYYSFESSNGFHYISTSTYSGLEIVHQNDYAPVLIDGTVTPTQGYRKSTIFTFSVNYTDLDNLGPEYVNLIINSTVYSMEKQDPSDDIYLDGCIYHANITLLDEGTYIYEFNCSDGQFTFNLGPFIGPDVLDAPVFDGMFITHEISQSAYHYVSNDTVKYSYESGEIFLETRIRNGYPINEREVNITSRIYEDSQSGDQIVHTPYFIFTHATLGDLIPIGSPLTDYDNDYIVIDESYMLISDEMIEFWILEDILNPENYAWYEKSTGILLKTEIHYNDPYSGLEIVYNFDFIDTNADVEYIPNNFAPDLSAGNIVPSSGTQKTEFTFSVEYSDCENNFPIYVNLVINGDMYPMEKQNPLDINFTDGCIYKTKIYLQPGIYEYLFECADWKFNTSTELFAGLNVVESPNLNAPILNNGRVLPKVGWSNLTHFQFSVEYIDEDNNAPDSIIVIIDSISHAMKKLDSLDSNYMDGCTYAFETKLSNDVEIHIFSYESSDGDFISSIGPFEGPEVNTAPLFEGMWINYTFSQAIYENPLPLRYSFISDSLFHVGIEPYVDTIYWEVDIETRCIIDSRGLWGPGDEIHTPFWIFTNCTFGDIIPISILYYGERLFNVTGEQVFYIPGKGYVEVWVLQDIEIQNSVALYEKSTGVLLNGSFLNPIDPNPNTALNFEMQDTNVEFAFINIESPLFDGMYSEYILDMEFYGSGQMIINYSFVGDDTFHVEWHRGNYSWLWYRVNNLTRIISSSYGMFLEGTHTPLWIHKCVSIGDIIPISMLYEGDRLFNITGEGFYLSSNGLVEIWILEDLINPGLYAWYEKSTGLLIKGEFGYMMYGYDIWYSLDFVGTNANFTYVSNEFAPELSDLILIPSTGTQKTEFHFSVVYSDQDNSFPTYIDLIIDGMRVPMHKQNPADDDYTDGCIYESLLYLQPGTYNYSVECADWSFNASSEVMTDLVVSESPNLNAPTLSNGYVSPEEGYNSTTIFEFFVTYADQDNNAPEFVKIILNSATHSMTKFDIFDTNYMDGCLYKYEASFDELGTYSFSFMGFDGDFLTEIGPISGPEVKKAPLFSGMWINYTIISSSGTNQSIKLSYSHLSDNIFKARWDPYGDWTHWETDILTRLINNSTVVWALEGEIHTPFWIHTDVSIGEIIPVCVIYEGDHFFRVSGELIYYLEGKGFIEVWLLEDLANPNNTAWYEKSTGILINCSNSISVPYMLGNMTYSFTFVDSNVDFQYATNLNLPELADIEVDPEVGERYDTTFVFSVNYIDLDNNAPAFLNISINGINYAMIKSDPMDITYYDGCEYYYSTTFDVLGEYTFQISTSDGKYSVLSEIYNFTVQDTTGPDLTIVSPVPQMYPDGSIVINVSSSAPDLSAFWYTLYWIEGEQWIGNPDGNPLEDGFGLLYLLEGKYIITVYANDTEGNVNSEVLHFSVNVPIIPGYPTLVVIAISVLVIAGMILRDYRKKKFGGNYTYICNHCGYKGKEEYIPRFCENCGGSFIYVPKIAEKQKYSDEIKKPNLT